MQGIADKEMISIVSFLIGIFIAERISRRIVPEPLLKKLDIRTIEPPSNINGLDKKVWEDAISTDKSKMGGEWVGLIERITYVAIFSFFRKDSYLLIGGWLAFKIAAKWEARGNIHKFPDRFTDSHNASDILAEVRARNELASMTLSRFLIGTLGNILAAFFGHFLAKLSVIIAKALILKMTQ